MTATRLIVFGRQGAGKGTQCKRLSDHFSVPHISTGDMLRAAVGEGTEFGLQAKAVMDAGQLVNDEIMRGVVADRLAEPDARNGWLLDGFPRTPGQAEDLWKLADPRPEIAIDIDVPEDEVLKRITGRRVCRNCGAIYGPDDESANSGICAVCGKAEVSARDDDSYDSIKKRLALYEEQTAPLLAWFDEHGLLRRIPGMGTSDEVFERILTELTNV